MSDTRSSLPRLNQSPPDALADPHGQPQAKVQILRNRARSMAQRPATAAQTGETLEFLEFQVACEKYGLGNSHIQEVCVLKDYTRLPCTPAFILGIMNLRGRIIAIVNLKKLFDLPGKGSPYHNKVIVIHNDLMTMGLLADEILGLRTLPVCQLQPALPTLTGKPAEYLKGLTPDWTAILEAEKILSDKSMLVQEEVIRMTK